MFDTVRKSSVPEKVVDHIRERLLSGELKDGDRLPPERELAEQLSISRATLRESFKILSMMGAIEKRQDGTYVKIDNTDILKNSLKLQLCIERGSMLDLIEARRVLEIENAGLAAARATDIQIEMLDRICSLMEADKKDQNKKAYIEKDIDFHIYLSRATNNSLFFEVFYAIRELLIDYQNERGVFITRFQGIQEHRKILDAIKAHDVKAARAAMEDHMNSSEKLYREMIAQEQQR